MSILASFIGIDRYKDPRIRDLTGARRDAMALWSLFADTVHELQARLIIDEEATTEGILRAFDETLGVAGPEDTVIISFSGHGSPNHYLATHDTDRDHIAESAIAMAELATRFRQSQAKIVLCILDCCFSGGAPARVIDDVPIMRDLDDPLTQLAGTGRIIISASNANEPALELPKERHGLLTKVLLDRLQAGNVPISLTAAMDDVVHQVRADALRLGFVQTPVLLNYSEGGVTLPVLKAGERHHAAFPEFRSVRLRGRVRELASCGLSPELVATWEAQFNTLNELQLTAVNDYGILSGDSLLVVAPTSSGKTFIGEMAAARALADQRKAVFLFPYKALTNEKYDQFCGSYGDRLHMRVVRCTGDYQDQTSAFLNGKFDIAVLTYEMFLYLLLGKPSILNSIGLVVIDEAQFLTDPRRGIVVELLLTYLIMMRKQGVEPQLIALSAVIGGINGFDAWLGCRALVTNERPIPLLEGVLDRRGVLRLINHTGQPEHQQFLPAHHIVQRKEKPSSQDVIVPLVKKLLAGNCDERVIIFRNSRGATEGCAQYLAVALGLEAAQDLISLLPAHDRSSSTQALAACLRGGTAFHNANLTRDERQLIEQAFRDTGGKIKALAATTTVAAGINTPASTVILAESEFVGDDGRPFTIAEYKNMAGRAGRLGYKETGKAIILADNSHEADRLYQTYVLGQPEALQSSFDPKQIETWILRLLVQVAQVKRDDAIHLLANTYGGYCAGRKDPQWRERVESRLTEALKEMLALQLLEEERGVISLSLLGKTCARSSLSYLSIIRLITMLKGLEGKKVTPELLLILLQALPESDDVYTPMMKRGSADLKWSTEVARRNGAEVARMLQRHAGDQWIFAARCKRALILADWIQGHSLATIEQTYSPNLYQGKISAGHVRQFADSSRFHLRSASQIAAVMMVGENIGDDALERLLRRLEIGIPSALLGLLDLPFTLTRGEYLALGAMGITDVNEFWASPQENLEGILGPLRYAGVNIYRPSSVRFIT